MEYLGTVNARLSNCDCLQDLGGERKNRRGRWKKRSGEAAGRRSGRRSDRRAEEERVPGRASHTQI